MNSQHISKSDTSFESLYKAASFDTQFVIYFYDTDEQLSKTRNA